MRYKVTRYEAGAIKDYGVMEEQDVKRILEHYSYDADMDMWFSPACKVAYTIEEVK